MLRIYIAGPITKGDYMINVRKAIDAAHALREHGLVPFVPHLSALWHLAYPRDYEDWMEYDFVWVRQCHALYRVPGESSGADREMEHARQFNIPVFVDMADLIEWARKQPLLVGEATK